MAARLARLLYPLVWRRTAHAAAKLHGFARAERASMLDLRAAARATACPHRAALYLKHADDEARHAVMFARRSAALCKEAGRPALGRVHADIEDLYRRLGEVDFLAFIHHGEARGRAQFETYIEYFERCGRDRDAAMFTAIAADERRHETYTRQLLVELAGGERAAAKALGRVRRWEFGRRWLRAGRALAVPTYWLLSVVLYVLVAPMTLWVRWARPATTGWRALAPEATRPEPAPTGGPPRREQEVRP